MSITWSSYLGRSPVIYSNKVLREAGLKHPPFCEKTIADQLGLKILEFTAEDIDAFRAQNQGHGQIADHLQTACAWLHQDGEGALVCVNADMSIERKRLSIVHEGGHSVMPWHQNVDYLCGNGSIDSTMMSRIEREAFMCGSAFLMPPKHFIEDMLSLNPSIASVRQLASRYVTSFEATAIWYASVHPGYCGFLVAEPTVSFPEPNMTTQQFLLPYQAPTTTTTEEPRYNLTVKYFIGSNQLSLFIRPGTMVPQGSSLHGAWTSRKRFHGEIPMSALGSTTGDRLRIDCEPWGNRVVALLWVPDPRVAINFGPGVYS